MKYGPGFDLVPVAAVLLDCCVLARRLDNTIQCRTGYDTTQPDTTGNLKTRQNKTRQDKRGNDRVQVRVRVGV